MSDFVKEITQDQFETEVLNAGVPVVLDFFSTDCPPCEALAPKFDAVAEAFQGKAAFLKVFRQGNRELAQKLGVSGSPTLVFFKDGREQAERLTGDIKKTELKRSVEGLLG